MAEQVRQASIRCEGGGARFEDLEDPWHDTILLRVGREPDARAVAALAVAAR